MRSNHTSPKHVKVLGLVLLALLLLLAVTLFLRFRSMRKEESSVPISSVPSMQIGNGQEEASPTAAPTEEPEPTVSEEPEAAPTTDSPTIKGTGGYTEETYTLVSDMVYTYKTLQREDNGEVERLLAELKKTDPAMGSVWEQIMATWDYVDFDLTVNPGALPDDLSTDDSLCIVVSGFQLLADGTMTPELTGRCEVALACVQKYPNAVVALTGGGTARDNHLVTEASVMADWMKEHGVDPSRLILEDTSMTSVQNAQNTCRILAEQYPQVKYLAMVSSDYHIPMVTLLFTEAAILYAHEQGTAALPYSVVSNAAFATAGDEEYTSTKKQAQYLWVLANPDY